MKCVILVVLVAVVCGQREISRGPRGLWDNIGQIFGIRDRNPCDRDVLPTFTEALNAFTVSLTKRAGYYSNNGNFVISPYTIWLSLASLVEYAEETLQVEWFPILNLPRERCLREKMYQLASNIEYVDTDITFQRRRALAISDKVHLNEQWVAFSEQHRGLDYLPIRYDEENFASILRAMGIQSPLTFYGNSIILDRMYYQGAWTTAFSEGYIEQAPFYNELGQAVAQIDYMRMKRRVRLAHIPIIDAKVLELPVGTDGRYTMLLTMGVKNNAIRTILDMLRNSFILDIISALTLSLIPLDIAVPRFFLSHGYNAKPLLEDIGFVKMFADPTSTRYISDPPALPSYYLQRVEMNITNAYIRNEETSPLTGFFETASTVATGLAKAVGRDFIANRPFMFTLIDTKTKVTIFTGVYSYPVENFEGELYL